MSVSALTNSIRLHNSPEVVPPVESDNSFIAVNTHQHIQDRSRRRFLLQCTIVTMIQLLIQLLLLVVMVLLLFQLLLLYTSYPSLLLLLLLLRSLSLIIKRNCLDDKNRTLMALWVLAVISYHHNPAIPVVAYCFSS